MKTWQGTCQDLEVVMLIKDVYSSQCREGDWQSRILRDREIGLQAVSTMQVVSALYYIFTRSTTKSSMRVHRGTSCMHESDV